MSFYRRPSPLEITYLGSDRPDYSPCVVEYLIDGIGELDVAQLQEALRVASLANPGVHMRLKGFWGWRYWDDNGPLPRLKVVESDWDGMNSENAPFLGGPIDVRNGPIGEVILVNGPKVKVLVFRLHHSASDGQGIMHWSADVFRVLRGESPQGSKATTTDWDVAQAQAHPEREIVEGQSIPMAPVSQQPTLRRNHWVRLRWQGNYQRMVPKLVLATARVAWQINGDQGRVLVRVPSNLRRLLPADADESLANLIGAIDLEITPASTVQTIRDAIQDAKQRRVDLAVFDPRMKWIPWVPSRWFWPTEKQSTMTHERGTYRMTGTVSFLGRVNLDDYSCPGFTAQGTTILPIAFETRPFFLIGTITQHGLDTALGVPRALADLPQLADLRDRIRQELTRLDDEDTAD